MISPYGGRLVDLTVDAEAAAQLRRRAAELPSLQLSGPSLCDLELLASGALSPLDRFLGRDDYLRVVDAMRLADGTLFPVPVTLPVPPAGVSEGREIALRDARNELVAVMSVEQIFDAAQSTGSRFATGPIQVAALPRHYDYRDLRRTPGETRRLLEQFADRKVVAFGGEGPISPAEEEFAMRACDEAGAALLLQPLAGLAKPGDTEMCERVRTYRTVSERHARTVLTLLPLAPRGHGTRETLLRAIIHRNYGATHMLSPEAAGIPPELFVETGVTPLDMPEITGRPDAPGPHGGFCVWLTGLPSAGKSTVAEILTSLLTERGRAVTLLDGDIVRTHLSKGLGFSREDRDTNIRRIGFVASEVVRHGGAAVCAAVSPYEATRNEVREMVGSGRFILVYVDTPLAVCEQRDPKGMYAKARLGLIKEFTGVDDPYEPPGTPQIRLAPDATAEEHARRILEYLAIAGFVDKVGAGLSGLVE